jgi:putative transcriptional regulator
LFRRDPQQTVSEMATIVSRRLADGTFVEVLPDGTTRPFVDKTDWAAIDAVTDDQIMARALADPDAQPIPEGAPRRQWRGLLPRILLNRLGLTVEEFAARYQVPVDLVAAWNIQKAYPDPVASAYLKAIAADPEGVARAVSGRKQAAE